MKKKHRRKQQLIGQLVIGGVRWRDGGVWTTINRSRIRHGFGRFNIVHTSFWHVCGWILMC